eukprot:m.1557039 g.1557039  ORF g.1557039 m.1557039 type:complete len:76 (-) comp25273_c0_seq3:7673-7900(-)
MGTIPPANDVSNSSHALYRCFLFCAAGTKMGMTRAYAAVGSLFRDGLHVEPDLEQAFAWFQVRVCCLCRTQQFPA